LPIDPEEPNDWAGSVLHIGGLEQETFLDWPQGEETTVRNLAAWFTDGRNAAQAA